jgi:site-specific DNA-adenine methylase
MWSYYGSKSKIVGKYPAPTKSSIVEPFAGSARYSLLYWERDVELWDKYPVVIAIWKWLQNCTPKDIIGLPSMDGGDHVDDKHFDCIEAKQLMGFIINQGSSVPKKSVSKVFGNGKMTLLIEREKVRIAKNLHKIKHWKINLGDYGDIPNRDATWFIDPPYQHGGQYYHSSVNNGHINFPNLAVWSKGREGQVMVCENSKANWMDFSYLSDLSGSIHKTKEVIWYKED